jgi:ABC-type polysaccharide/polyol phosphate export permease
MAVSPATATRPTPMITTAGADLVRGLSRWELYGRLGWLDVKRRYRRTILGPLWGVLNLGLLVAALGGIGTGLWQQEADAYLPFLTSGLVVWMLISTMTTEACTVFIFGQNFVRQMRFDYSILVYALIWRNLITFVHNLVVYAIVVLLFKPQLLGGVTLLAVPGIAIVLLNGTWIALLLGTFCLRFRDIPQLVGTLIQISIFITPIFWPPSYLQGTYRSIFVSFNPLYYLIEIVRAPLIGQVPDASSYLAALVITTVGWAAAYVVFSMFRGRLTYWS